MTGIGHVPHASAAHASRVAYLHAPSRPFGGDHDALPRLGDDNVVELRVAQLGSEGILRRRFAVYDDDLAQFAAAAHALRKINEVALIGVGTEAIERYHIGVAWMHYAEDANVATQLYQAPTQGVLGLKADDDHGIACIFDAAAQVMQHAAAFAHATAGENDGRAG